MAGAGSKGYKIQAVKINCLEKTDIELQYMKSLTLYFAILFDFVHPACINVGGQDIRKYLLL